MLSPPTKQDLQPIKTTPNNEKLTTMPETLSFDPLTVQVVVQ